MPSIAYTCTRKNCTFYIYEILLFSHLYGSVVCDEFLLHFPFDVPQSQIDQVLEQVLIDDLKFAGQNATRVYVARVRLDRFVVAENLSRRRRRHGSEKQAVTKPKTKNQLLGMIYHVI